MVVQGATEMVNGGVDGRSVGFLMAMRSRASSEGAAVAMRETVEMDEEEVQEMGR